MQLIWSHAIDGLDWNELSAFMRPRLLAAKIRVV